MNLIEKDDENIEEDEELEETTEKDVFTCSNCEGEVDHLIHRGYGWVKCPRCDKGIRRVEIPKKFHYLIKKVADYEPKERKKEEEYVPPLEPKEGKADIERIPFDRPQEHWEILDEILTSFGVNDRARALLVKRAQRQKKPIHPQELQRSLEAFKSGLKKGELSYVAEEYYLALQAERRERKERTSSRSRYISGYDEEEEEDRRSEKRYSFDDDRDEEFPVWERGRSGKHPTYEDLNRFREDLKRDGEVRELKRELREKEEEANYLRSRPPVEPDTRKDDFYQMMMDQQERADRERQRAHETQMATDQRAHDERIESMKREQGARDTYTEKLLELTRDATKQPIRASTDGFQEDGPRVLAQAISSAAEVVRDGKPIKQLTEAALATQKANQPPDPLEIDRKAPEKIGILDSLPDDLVDEE